MLLMILFCLSLIEGKKPQHRFYGLIPKEINGNIRLKQVPSQLESNTTQFYPYPLDYLPKHLAYCGKYHRKNPHKTKNYCIPQTMNQGECGCCYSMSLAQVLQAHYTRLTSTYKVISTQHILDCSKNDGCYGGWPVEVLNSLDVFVSEIDYPYHSFTFNSDTNQNNYKKQCKRGFKSIIQVTDFHQVRGPLTFDQMKVLLIQHGPFIGLLHANEQLESYHGGILHLNCTSDNSINHAVMVVGYGEDDNNNQYIIIRNSWGNRWGEKGYARLSFSNLCGLNGELSTRTPTIIYLSTSLPKHKYHN